MEQETAVDRKTADRQQPVELPWPAEFCCWTTVALAPLLTWVNGPAVSADQFVVRTALFCLALAGGIGLRVASLLRKRRTRRESKGGTVSGADQRE
ncbi:MAG: hypothetical protein ACLQNE_28080 [Thermoguttaceae bacterium]